MKKFLLILFFLPSLTFANTYYYADWASMSYDGDLNNPANYFYDSAHLLPASTLPVDGDTLYLDGGVLYPFVSNVNLASFHIAKQNDSVGTISYLNPGFGNAYNISVSGLSDVGTTGVMSGGINADSYVSLGGLYLYEYSNYSAGSVLSETFFHDHSFMSAVSYATSTFYDDSYCDTSCTINATSTYFYNNSYNSGTINGNACFFDTTVNSGTINGNAFFASGATNSGSVFGSFFPSCDFNPATTSPFISATSTVALAGTISYGLAIIIVILFVFLITYFFNVTKVKKPWH